MPSTYLFIAGTIMLSLNFVRFYGLAISDWFYFGALGLAIIETAWFDRKNSYCWTRNRFLWPAGLILFGAIISTAKAIFVRTAIIEILQQLFVITLFISLIWVMVNRGKAGAIIQTFIWSGVFTASIAVLDYMTGTRIGPILSGTPNVQFWGRYAGTLGHPNKFGYFLVITSILSFANLLSKQTGGSRFFTKFFRGLLVCIQLYGIYLSSSLTAYLGLLLGLGALLLSSKLFLQRSMKFITPIIYIATLVFILGIIFGNPTMTNTTLGLPLVSTALTRVETITAQSRWVIYEQALDRIFENPLVGVGYDQISTSGLGLDFRELPGTVHNLLLQTWYVGGLFAFIGWLIIYSSLGWGAISTLHSGEKRHTQPVLLGTVAAVLSVLLMDQFQSAIYQREKWLVIGLFISMIWSQRR